MRIVCLSSDLGAAASFAKHIPPHAPASLKPHPFSRSTPTRGTMLVTVRPILYARKYKVRFSRNAHECRTRTVVCSAHVFGSALPLYPVTYHSRTPPPSFHSPDTLSNI